MGKFSDSSYSILDEYFSVLLSPRTGDLHNSYINSVRKTIWAVGGIDSFLYQKSDSGDFIKHKFTIVDISGNDFVFTYKGKFSSFTDADDLEMGKEMYFRKDSFFHDWLRNNSDQYEDAINTNKLFIYFGKIYEAGMVDGRMRYNIIFEGMKDYVVAALPEHNQTDNLVEFFKVYFDQVHHDIYNLTKTLWSMIDAKEVNIKHINYLATRANIETDKDKIDTELLLREFIDQLPYWLKRKGTYTAYYIIYRLLLGNTKNKLNIYERWVEWCLRRRLRDIRRIDDSFFEDHHILEHYGVAPTGGAGIEYYREYDPDKRPFYPDYTDIAPSGECIQKTHTCNSPIDLLTDFIGVGGGGTLKQFKNNLQIDGFDQSAGNDLYLWNYQIPSTGNHLRYCLTASMDSSAAPSGGIWVWMLSKGKGDRTVDETIIENKDFIGVSFENIGSRRRFKIWEYDNGSLYAAETSAYYDADREYFLTIEKLPSAAANQIPTDAQLRLYVYSDPLRRTAYRKDLVKLNLNANQKYENFYPINFKSSSVSCSFSGDLENYYSNVSFTDSLGVTGYPILSPHYKVEIDLSSEPISENNIISEDTIDEILRYWQYIKPVSKFVSYHELISPIGRIDESGEYISLYRQDFLSRGVCDTRYTGGLIYADISGSRPPNTNSSPSADFYFGTDTFVVPIASLTWTFDHELNSRKIITETYDKDDFAMYPAKVNVSDKDTIQYVWTPARRGRAFAATLKPWNASFYTSGASGWNIIHNMGTSGASAVVASFYNDSLTEDIIPDTVQVVDFNTLTVTFGQTVSGYAFVRDEDYYHEQLNASTTWTIEHDLNIRGAIARFYDHNGYQIRPADIQLVDYNTLEATFAEEVSGTAALIVFQRELTEGDVRNLLGTKDNPGYWKVGNGGSDTFDPVAFRDLASPLVSGRISDILETSPALSGTYVIKFNVPKQGEYTFNEAGVFDSNKVLQWYTRMSWIHKPEDVQLDFVYRIRKLSTATS